MAERIEIGAYTEFRTYSIYYKCHYRAIQGAVCNIGLPCVTRNNSEGVARGHVSFVNRGLFDNHFFRDGAAFGVLGPYGRSRDRGFGGGRFRQRTRGFNPRWFGPYAGELAIWNWPRPIGCR